MTGDGLNVLRVSAGTGKIGVASAVATLTGELPIRGNFIRDILYIGKGIYLVCVKDSIQWAIFF